MGSGQRQQRAAGAAAQVHYRQIVAAGKFRQAARAAGGDETGDAGRNPGHAGDDVGLMLLAGLRLAVFAM